MEKNDFDTINPLDMVKELLEMEFYNKVEAEDLFKQIDEEFNGKGGAIESLMIPSVYGMLDAVGRKAEMSISPGEVVRECKEFTIDNYNLSDVRVRSLNKKIELEIEEREFNRNKLDHVSKRDNYRDEKTNGKTVKDEYIENKSIYKKRNDAEKRNFKDINSHTTDVDHIVPLKELHEQTKRNILLKESDIKVIGNLEDNYALTNSKLNRSKGDKTNSQYIESNKNELSKETIATMKSKEKQANSAIAKEANKRVVNNFKNNPEMRNTALKEMSKTSLKVGVDSAKTGIYTRMTILLIKTTYFEIVDSFKNGITYNIDASTTLEALKIRLNRAVTYIITSLKDIMSGSIKDMIIEAIKGFVKLIFDFFLGAIKMIGQIVVKGFGAIVQSIKLLVSPPEGMTLSQRMDAITKLLATTALGVLFVSANETISKIIPFAGPLNTIIMILLEGFSVAGVIYILDKLDLFGAKWEKKIQRINEIFDQRSKEIKEGAENIEKNVLATLFEQKSNFMDRIKELNLSLDSKNLDKANEMAFLLASTFNINLEYENLDEFLDFMDSTDTLVF